jgi:ferredoxin
MGRDHEHRICTYEEAEQAIRAHDTICMNACFCRKPARDGKTSREYCGDPIDTCLGFDRSAIEGFGVDYRQITREEALDKWNSWREQGNLFRFMEDERWICLCCTCGCQWFRDEEGNRVPDTCDPIPYVERTDPEVCSLCGECVLVCPRGARVMGEDALSVDSNACYGCSACEYVCPEQAVTMVPR